MEELALTILDIVQNSIKARASLVKIEIIEMPAQNRLSFRIEDNGCGMDAEMLSKVTNPFVTSRTTRKVGLGLPLLDMLVKLCNGSLSIESEVGKGTIVEAVFPYDHIDRPPLGNMKTTLVALLIGNPGMDICYRHQFADRVFEVHSAEISQALGDIPLSHPEVLEWLEDFLTQGMESIYGGVMNENS